MISKILWLSAAGTAGTLARVGLSMFVQRAVPSHTQLGTLVVNVLGCFLFGLAYGWFEGHAEAAVRYRLIVLAGFMGAFTTFSSYVSETLQLTQGDRLGLAVTNLVAQNALGFVALGVGITLGRPS
jgi:fluoride exporter